MRKSVLLLLCFVSLNATTIKEAIQNALVNNPEIQSLQSNMKAYRLYVDEEQGSYLPVISLDAYLEDKQTIKEYYDGRDRTELDQNGYNIMLMLDQTIYDGGLTNAKVGEAKYNYNKTRIENIAKIEDAIFTVTESYLNLVKYEELEQLSKNNLEVHENYLTIARDSEAVSGEVLDRIQVESKLSYAQSKYIQMKTDKEGAKSTFEKMTGKEPKGFICRPNIDTSKIAQSLKENVNTSLKFNYDILAQVEALNAQREVLNQEKSRFLPVLSVQLSEEIDKELEDEGIKSTITSAKLKLSYTLFNGFKDKAVYERERIFLKESQEVLDDTTNGVIEEVQIAYNTYVNTQEKVQYLKTYVEKNKEILKIYKEQFLGGTRTFIDILNNEAELFRAKTELIEEQFKMYTAYYQLMMLSSRLSDTIVSTQTQECQKIVVDTEEALSMDQLGSTENELEGLLQESVGNNAQSSDDLSGLLQENPEPVVNEEEQKELQINEMLDNLMNEIYEGKKEKSTLQPEENKAFKEQMKEFNIDLTNDTSLSSTVLRKHRVYSLKDVMLKKKSEYYTIILATVNPSLDYKKFIEDNNIKHNAVAYHFGQKDKYVKIIYGAYKTYEDAFDSLIKLDTNLLSNKPYVERVDKHIKLFHKYSNVIEE